jgi:hypothetical protein
MTPGLDDGAVDDKHEATGSTAAATCSRSPAAG